MRLKSAKTRQENGLKNRRYGKFIYQLQNIFPGLTGESISQTRFTKQIYYFYRMTHIGRKLINTLVVIDIASRYKDAEALTSKESSEVAKAFQKIYSRKLKWPEILMADPGKEFFGNVTTLMTKHKVKFQRSEAGNHRAQVFVERANRTLGEKIFTHQYAQEMADAQKSKSRSREWVERLPAILKVMNNEVTRLTGKEPTKVLKSADVPINKATNSRPVGLDEVKLPPGVKVRYLYVPGEGEGGERRRATDPIWSLEIYDLSRSVVSAEQPVLNYLSGGPKRSFVREELQVVPNDTELPPTSVL